MHLSNRLNCLPHIFDVKNPMIWETPIARTEEEKAKDDIKWINAFYKRHQRAPIFDRNNMIEYSLCEKLQRLRFNYEALPFLKKLDTYKLLAKKPSNAVGKFVKE
ncbi:MAG: hypothetical protein V4588_03960 [Pseudomonadota bacterium]